jgi:DNA-binding transcriptional ArsR family regulator
VNVDMTVTSTVTPAPDQVVQEPILAAIDAKIEEAERLANRYRAFRRLVEEALQLDIGQLSLDGLLEESANGHETSEPTPTDPGAGPPASSPGGAEAEEPDTPGSAGSEDPDPPERQGGGSSKPSKHDPLSKRDDVLDAIKRHPDGLTVKAIAEESGVHRTSVNTHVKALEEAGHVRREPNPDDGRSSLIVPAIGSQGPRKPLGPPKRGAADRVDRKPADGNPVLEAVEKAGREGITAEAIGKQIGIGAASVRGKLSQLVYRGAVVASLDDPPVYRTGVIGMVPADENGAKTEHERKLVDAIKRSPVPVTSNEAASNAGVNSQATGAILSGLARRGVLRRIDPEGVGGAVRWEVAA